MQEHTLDDQTLAAFVDGELDAPTSQAVIQAMERDADVRHRVYRLRRTKDLMKLGFGQAHLRSTPERAARRAAHTLQWLAAAIGAVAILAATGMGSYQLGRHAGLEYAQFAASSVRQTPHRVILHISEFDPARFARTLDYAVEFVRAHRALGGEVAVIANAGGIDLLRAGVSPYESRISDIIDEHDAIHFIACAAAINELRRKGVSPTFIDEVDTRKPALDQIIEHVQAGWKYLKVKELPTT